MRWRHTRQMKLFDDRGDAGRQLAQRLAQLSGKAVVVLGLPRGGVPVAFEVAKSLQAPLDVLVVRKLGVPFQPELAFGAIGEDGVRVLNDDVVRGTHLDAAALDRTAFGTRCAGLGFDDYATDNLWRLLDDQRITGWASHVPSLVGESMAVAKPSSHDCRATITGTRAACKTALLTDPRSMPVKPPRP